MRIRWSEPAVHDLTSICDYIGSHTDLASARRIGLIIYASIGSLAKFPHRGRPGRKIDTRELILPSLPYVIFYRIRADTVEITRILHGAQNWPRDESIG